jgi:hypothetical protein
MASQGILNIKTRYLLKPLCEELQKSGSSLEVHVHILANTLLLCATLTRDLSKDEDALLRNFATGIILFGRKTGTCLLNLSNFWAFSCGGPEMSLKMMTKCLKSTQFDELAKRHRSSQVQQNNVERQFDNKLKSSTHS